MTDAETIAELRALLAARDAEIAELRERGEAFQPKTWREAEVRAHVYEILAYKLRRKADP